MNLFEALKAEMLTVLASALPVIELRGAIPFGMTLGLRPLDAFFFAYLGSLLPAPFLLLFVRPMLKKISHFRLGIWLDRKFRIKAAAHSKAVKRYGSIALAIFVAIPLPGTGVWSGAVLATFLDIRFKKAFPAIAAGNLVAGITILILSGLLTRL